MTRPKPTSKYNHKPKVSIIIPVFDGELFLHNCLDSILNQTLTDYEVICINDGSKDNSLTILEEYGETDERFIIITKQSNFGQSLARNEGLRIARSDYVCFIDDDDFIDENYLKSLWDQITLSDADICLCGGDEYLDAKGVYKTADWIFNREKLPEAQIFSASQYPRTIFQMFGEAPWARILRREFVMKEKLTFNHFNVFEDFSFSCLSLCLANKITYIDKLLYHHRKHTRQASSRLWNNLVNFDALIVVKKYLTNNGLYGSYKLSYLDKCMYAIQWRIQSASNSKIRAATLELAREKIIPELEVETDYSGLSPLSKVIYNTIMESMPICGKCEGLNDL